MNATVISKVLLVVKIWQLACFVSDSKVILSLRNYRTFYQLSDLLHLNRARVWSIEDFSRVFLVHENYMENNKCESKCKTRPAASFVPGENITQLKQKAQQSFFGGWIAAVAEVLAVTVKSPGAGTEQHWPKSSQIAFPALAVVSRTTYSNPGRSRGKGYWRAYCAQPGTKWWD